MATATKSGSKLLSGWLHKACYTVDTSGFGYTIISNEVRQEFNFITNDIPNQLDVIRGYIEQAASINDAFYVKGKGVSCDFTTATDEIINDITTLQSGLQTLYSAFMKDIDEVNAELEYNFGWIIIGHCHGKEDKEKQDD